MFGGDAQRLSQAQAPGLHRAGFACPAFGLVGGDDHVFRTLAKDIGEIFVRCRHADARVDHEQADIGLVHGTLGQAAHPALQAVVLGHFQAGAVDHDKAQVAQPGRAFAQVAGDAGLVIDQGQALADKAVEQGRFADIGPTDDGECECHLNACNWPLRETT